jgi:hypothetical protein
MNALILAAGCVMGYAIPPNDILAAIDQLNAERAVIIARICSLPTGVTRKEVGPSYSRNGKPVNRAEAIRAVEGLEDDSAKLRITVIGADANERAAALAEIGKPSWAIVRSYPPDHWHVAASGFVTSGHPTTYVQRPDGTVLHRQDDLTGLASAIRNADPNYNPALDPKIAPKKGGIKIPDVFTPAAFAAAAIGGALVLLAQAIWPKIVSSLAPTASAEMTALIAAIHKLVEAKK